MQLPNLLILFLALAPLACASGGTTSTSGDPDAGGTQTIGEGPEVDASTLGKSCTGVGTSVGDTTAIEKATCQGGYCSRRT